MESREGDEAETMKPLLISLYYYIINSLVIANLDKYIFFSADTQRYLFY